MSEGEESTDDPEVEQAAGEQATREQGAGEPAAPTRRRRLGRPAATAAVVALGAVALAAAIAWREPPPPPAGLVVLYGDSLSMEASPAFVAEMDRIADAGLELRTEPGTSPCDVLDQMRTDLALEPDVVVIQYVGNNASECMRGPGGEELTGPALVERFDADVRTATELFATSGARVVLVGGPHAPGLPGDGTLDIAERYDEIVNEWAGRDLGRVRYADAAATVTDDDHLYAERLPCRDDEGPEQGCDDGEVIVRNPDRVHFCPVDHGELVCPVPSPGARRFGEEMARVAALALDPAW